MSKRIFVFALVMVLMLLAVGSVLAQDGEPTQEAVTYPEPMRLIPLDFSENLLWFYVSGHCFGGECVYEPIIGVIPMKQLVANKVVCYKERQPKLLAKGTCSILMVNPLTVEKESVEVFYVVLTAKDLDKQLFAVAYPPEKSGTQESTAVPEDEPSEPNLSGS